MVKEERIKSGSKCLNLLGLKTVRTNQYEVIRDIEEALKALFRRELDKAGFKSVHFYSDIPTADKIKKLPAISFYLYNVCSDERYREREQILVSETTEDGSIVEYYVEAPLPLHLHFALSTFAETPEEEHILFGFAMKVLLDNSVLEGRDIKGSALADTDNVSIMLRNDTDFDDVNALWRGVGEHIRPTAFYWIPIELISDRKTSEVRRVLRSKVNVGARR